MASDVDDLTKFYTKLPSIFQTDSVTTDQRIEDKSSSVVDSEQVYQPMFGSFLFADSEPLTRAAFVASAASSNESTSVRDGSNSTENFLNRNNDDENDDDDIEEDDFDGIPIRHGTNLIKTKISTEKDFILGRIEQEKFLNQFVRRINSNENDLNLDENEDEDTFLNGFTDDQQTEINLRPSIFRDIPDIDDPNEHEDEQNEEILFDRMDMLDQSDSIRSSSPDSVLSSSHLRDEQDDDDDVENEIESDEINNVENVEEDEDDDVTQWNDDFLLARTNIEQNRPNAPSPSRLFLNMNSHDQVDFIDSSRSESRCSHASSNFSMGYNDQAHIIIDDDGLVTSSSDSDDEEDNDRQNNVDDEPFDEPSANEDELSLKINLDPPRSRSLSEFSSNSSQIDHCSLNLVGDQSPIIPMDEDIPERTTTPITVAPIAQVDDEDNDDEEEEVEEILMESNNTTIFTRPQPILADSIWKDLRELKRNQLACDIVDIQHIYQDHQEDDEFIAVMHNPMIFEEVLTDNNDQTSKQHEQIGKSVNLNGSQEMPNHNSIDESFDDSSTILEIKRKSNSPSLASFSSVKTTNNRPVTHVNHLDGKEEEEEEASAMETTILNRKTEEIQSHSSSTTNVSSRTQQIANGHDDNNQEENMSSDDESENDSELLNTLAQIHGLVQSTEKSFNDSSHDDGKNNDEKEIDIFHYDLRRFTKNDQRKIYSQGFSLSSSTSSMQLTDDDLVINDDNIEFQRISNEIQSNLFLFNKNSSFDDLLMEKNRLASKSPDHLSGVNENDFDLKSYLNWLINHFKDDDVLTERNEEIDSSSVDELKPIVEKFIDQSIRSAFAEICCFNQVAEQLVDRILIEAINQINLSSIDCFPSEICSSLSGELQRFDPFDKQFDQVWSKDFQSPDQQNFHSDIFFLDDNQRYSNSSPKSINKTSQLVFSANSNLTTNDSMICRMTTSVYADLFHDSSSFSKEQNLDASPSNPFNDETEENRRDSSSSSSSDEENKNVDPIDQDPNRRSKFQVFASPQPLNSFGIDSISVGIDNEFNEVEKNEQIETKTTPWPTDEKEMKIETQNSTDGDNEPWELGEIGDENGSKKNFEENFSSRTDSNFIESKLSSTSSSSESEKEIKEENYDNYFTNLPETNPTETFDDAFVPPRNVRFKENDEEINLGTPRDSLNESDSTSDTEEDEDSFEDENDPTQDFPLPSDRIDDHMSGSNFVPFQKASSSTNGFVPKNAVQTEKTTENNEFLPPPLPSLPTSNQESSENIPGKIAALPQEIKLIPNPWGETETTSPTMVMTDVNLNTNNSETFLVRSSESAILRSTSKDPNEDDPDDSNEVISCVIDNNAINIDAKTISPFKCIINSAGHLSDENQTVIVALYGCWLPDHRLREYRYIMDQLFYYVYQKIEKLVTNDYVLVYFHGATPKYRTPDLKFLRKCYQMINFRLRKNLRSVYIVHPTRWLRTVIALSRPFFSNKFYQKVHYVYTISELERQFPENHLSIPVIVEQTDWIYSQKYDRQNASIKRSIERASGTKSARINDESTA